jgi:fatty acid desaturase
MQEACSNPRPINWYRTPLDSKEFKSLHEKSDLMGWLQTGGYLGLLCLTGGLVLYSGSHWPFWVTLLLLLVHGTCFAFQINAVHELGHNTVFKTRALNAFFVRIFAFLGWINFEAFNTSHTRHHRYTLHQPDDLEIVLPQKFLLFWVLKDGIVNPMRVYGMVKDTVRFARGQMRGEWETFLFPEGSPERKAAVDWARTLLIGHGLVIAGSLWFHLWLLPVVLTFGSCYGAWLQTLCNATQHIGMQDDVPDFRLCTRTILLNPVVQFLYWHMNYHIEHHMYAAVPCYKLGRLHRLIKHDLPHCPNGIIEAWREIVAIQKIQETDPGYQHVAVLPPTAAPAPVPA